MDKSILFLSAGRRVGLLNAARESLALLGLGWRVLAVDVEPELSAACHMADSFYRVPRANSDEYVPALLAICRRENVRLIIPTIDTELGPLSAHKAIFDSECVRINIGDPEFVNIARDKALTGRRLADLGIATPATWAPPPRNEEELIFPAIAKPNSGSSSIGVIRYRSAEEYRRNLPSDDCIVQELLEGPEYTVNVFCDIGGSFRCAVPHQRIEVRGGEVSKGRTERRSDLAQIARSISTLPGARGAFCFQAILTKRGPVVFEINARFGGGYPIAHRAGGTFIKWLLEETNGLSCSADDKWQDNLLAIRFDSEIYVT